MIRQLLKDSVIYGLTGVAARVSTVLLIPLYTRLLDVADYGRLDLLLACLAILNMLGGMQIEGGIGRGYYEAKRAGRHRSFVGAGLILRIGSALAWTVVYAAVYHLWLVGRGGIEWKHALPLLLLVHPTHLFGLASYLLRLERRARAYCVVTIGEAVTAAALAVAATVGFGWGVPGILWAMAAARGLWTVVLLVLVRSQYQWRLTRRDAREILHYSIPGVPAVVCIWMQGHAARLVLAGVLTMGDLGLFGLASKIALMGAIVDQAFRLAWGPKSMELIGTPGAPAKYVRAFELYLAVMLTLCAAIGAGSYLAIKLLATDVYLAAAGIVPWLAMGNLWSGAAVMLSVGMKIARRMAWTSLTAGLGALVNVAALWWTVESLGLSAAGVTYLIGTMIAAGLTLLASQHCYRLPYRTGVIAAAAAGSILIPILLLTLPEPGTTWGEILWNSALRSAVVVAICAAGFSVFRIPFSVGSRVPPPPPKHVLTPPPNLSKSPASIRPSEN